MEKIALLGTMDTKGEEYSFLQACIEEHGFQTLLVDVGILETPRMAVDIPSDEVALAAGVSLDELRSKRDRGLAVAAMGEGNRLIDMLPGVVDDIFDIFSKPYRCVQVQLPLQPLVLRDDLLILLEQLGHPHHAALHRDTLEA